MKIPSLAGLFLHSVALPAVMAVALILSSPVQAAGLTGDTITGTLNFCALGNGGNAFGTSSGTAPTTFEFNDGDNDDTAAFSDTTLTVQDVVGTFACGWGMSFTDTSTAFPTLTLLSSSFSPDLTYALTDGVITVSWAGTPDSIDSVSDPGTFTAVFNIDGVVPTPEPASLSLFVMGVAGVGLLRRRHRARRAISL